MGRALMQRVAWNCALDKRIVELADGDLGNNEIAAIVGTTRSAIENRLRKLGYRRTAEQKTAIYKRAAVDNGGMPPHKPLDVREAEFAAKFDMVDRLAGFEYVGGYTKSECSVRIRCKSCGCVFTRWAKRLVGKKPYEVNCPECSKPKQKPKPRRRHHLRRRGCAWCGDAFMAEGREIYCLRDCCKQANKKQIRERNKRLGLNSCVKRAKHYGVAYELGITLDKLVKRDGNRCHICGGECDRSDKAYGNVGPMYPTVDHVVPLSKGGTHTWGNVKLAHFQCNSEKGARLEEDDGGRDAERVAS